MVAQAAPRVLLVDDDPMTLQILQMVIATAGHEVCTALGAELALTSMQREFSPIIISDVQMPGMDGLALCRIIRRQPYSTRVYFMLHSANASEEFVLAGLETGADDYLSKPQPRSQLVCRLRTAHRILSLEHSLTLANR
jgi:two-component system, cell cycle response regulator